MRVGVIWSESTRDIVTYVDRRFTKECKKILLDSQDKSFTKMGYNKYLIKPAIKRVYF